VSKAYDGKTIIKDFSTRIVRGDRIGLIGPNGAGKTTLLRLLCGELAADSGTVRLGTNLQPAYFDQRREHLDPEATLWHALTDGAGDSINVRGTQRHVMGYLKDFLFEERQAFSPVRSLSGGERNRLLLAKLLAKPSNLLIMDEPTNDLDIESLDLMIDMLADYDGTLLLVSHDRDFLNRLVTSTIFVEGLGNIAEYVGGYDDAMAQRQDTPAEATRSKGEQNRERGTKVSARLSYKDQRALEALPAEMDRLRRDLVKTEAALHDPALFARDRQRFVALTEDLDKIRQALADAEERWLALEMMREDLEAVRR
jgi:ATP-binding cassette subfamily F protein uup